jgi:hypothetical protein
MMILNIASVNNIASINNISTMSIHNITDMLMLNKELIIPQISPTPTL